MTELGAPFDDAVAWASSLHREQRRKLGGAPYLSHLLSVAGLVLQHGGDGDQAVAALLHDAIEDQGVTDAEIAARAGGRVATIVRACTDADVLPKPPWRGRKEAFLARLSDPSSIPDDALVVIAADKLDNSRSMLAGLREHGDDIWAHFNAGKADQAWYLGEVARVLRARLPGPLTDELATTVAGIRNWPGNEVGLLEGLASTRAIRRFTSDPIPDADLARILFAASRAPSGSNRQPFRFLVLRDGPAATRAKALLGESFREGWNMKRAEDGYDRGSGVEDASPKARMARAMQHFVDHFEQTPVVVLPCLDRQRPPALWEGASVYPACQNLLLAARALGYGGVLTTWHVFVEDELREVLAIPPGVVIAATIPLGRPAGRHGPVRRLPLADLVHDDRWDAPALWAIDPPGTRFTRAGPP